MERSATDSQGQSQLDCLSNLTIIVPTYQRPNQVLETVKFWSERGPRLLILDGSPDPVEDCGLFESAKGLTYVHLPESVQARMAHSSEYIQTEYVTLMGDDEVHMPSSLAASIKELEDNPGLASCMGWAVGFRCRVGKGSVSRIEGFTVYPGLHFLENNHKYAGERLFAHFDRYEASNIYAVVRTDAYKNAMKLINAPGERVFAMGEYEFEIAILYQGGNRILPNLHWLRNLGDSGNFTQDPDTNRTKMFHEYFLDPKYSAWKEEFLSTRSEILASFDGQDVSHVRTWLEEALQRFAEKEKVALARFKPTTIKQFSFFLRKCVRSVIPTGQRYRARKISNKIMRRNRVLSLQEVVRNLSLSGMVYSEEELDQVMKERFGG
jgi:glycosyltransferase domain-containing protein